MILKLLDRLIFDPDRDATPAPPGNGTPKREYKKPEPVETNQEIVRDRKTGRPRVFTTPKADTFEWADLDKAGQVAGLDRYDKEILEMRNRDTTRLNLDDTKYHEFKAKWTEGKTAKEASQELSRDKGSGYKLRTAYEYYSAINQANEARSSSPAFAE